MNDELEIKRYDVPKKLESYFRNVITRSWIEGTLSSEEDENGNLVFATTASEKVFYKALIRAKMEWLNQLDCFKNYFVVSESENKDTSWLEATKEFLKNDKVVVFLTQEEIDKYSKELDEKLNKE